MIAGWLREKEITHAFGIIGGGNVVLWDSISRLCYTQIVSVHHEQAAAMAATYYYRTCNKLAVVLCTTGAGSSNAITGVLAAQMDSIPLLVISGNEASKYMDKPTRTWGVQGYDSSGIAERFCKMGLRPQSAVEVIPYLEEAYETALKPRQGPVWVDIPKDLQSAVL